MPLANVPASCNVPAASELRAQLEDGDIRVQREALAVVLRSVTRLTYDPVGCRAVQLALTIAKSDEAACIASALHGQVPAAIASPYGNYVIQKLVETVPTEVSSFVAAELTGVGADAARHRYGCRIVCRLLEHSASHPKLRALVGETLSQAEEVCRHTFGHHVAEAVLEHGAPEHQHMIAEALRNDLQRYARNRNASHVLERAFEFCSDQDKVTLAMELCEGSPDSIVSLAQSHFGTHIVRALLRLPWFSGRVREELQGGLPQLEESKHGQRLLAELGLSRNGWEPIEQHTCGVSTDGLCAKG